MEFILIRHTRCDVASGTCYGRLDLPLANTASDDIERTLGQTPRVDIVFSSPAQRCFKLASALATRDGCELRVLQELQELNFGAWEGMRWDEIPRSQSDEWAADPWNRAPPGGETESELWERATRAGARLMQLTQLQHIAVVSHGGPLRLLRCVLAQKPASERWSVRMEAGEVVCITPKSPTNGAPLATSGARSGIY